MGDFKNRVVMVTGAAGAIGRAMARDLSDAGARVVMCDIHSESGADDAPPDTGPRFGGDFFQLNVASEADWLQVIAHVRDQYGALDALINNAGVTLIRPFEETSVQELEWVMRINVHGAFLGTKHALPLLRETAERHGRYASIVNVASVFAQRGFPFGAAYSMSKGAVRMLTASTAVEFANRGLKIRVNSVSPGIVDSPLLKEQLKTLADFELMGADSQVQVRALLRSRIPMERFAEPDEVARVVLFLIGDDSGYVTGSDYVVDGGATA